MILGNLNIEGTNNMNIASEKDNIKITAVLPAYCIPIRSEVTRHLGGIPYRLAEKRCEEIIYGRGKTVILDVANIGRSKNSSRMLVSDKEIIIIPDDTWLYWTTTMRKLSIYTNLWHEKENNINE